MNPLRGRNLGVGVGWRRELARWIDERPRLQLVEVMAEDFGDGGSLPVPLQGLLARGATVVPHSVSLSLGGADLPDERRLSALDALARRLGAPVVSDHIAFVRAGEWESGHLLPPPRTQEALDVMVENVNAAKGRLSTPLALENIACLFEWPGAQMDEPTFVRELLERTGTLLILDVANLFANAHNFGWDPGAYLDALPLERIAYVHIAGGREAAGFFHDTHAHPLGEGALGVLRALCERVEPPGVLLERDDRFPPPAEIERETETIRAALRPLGAAQGALA